MQLERSLAQKEHVNVTESHRSGKRGLIAYGVGTDTECQARFAMSIQELQLLRAVGVLFQHSRLLVGLRVIRVP